MANQVIRSLDNGHSTDPSVLITVRLFQEMVKGTDYQVTVERIFDNRVIEDAIESSPTKEMIRGTVAKLKLLIKAFPDANIEKMTQQCELLDIHHANASTKYSLTVQHLFHDGITWGRVTLFYAFSVGFLVHTIQRNLDYLVDSVVNWCIGVVKTKLNPWIEQSGGWENFIEFARKASEGNESDHSNGLGGKLLAAAAVLGIAALGLFAVGKSH